MTPSEKQQLAESAAEFLGFKPIPQEDSIALGENEDTVIYDLITEPWHHKIFDYHTCEAELLYEPFFKDLRSAPILMALGKREMIKMEFNIRSGWTSATYFYLFWPYGVFGPRHERSYNDNEYLAFWSAVMKAVKK